MTETIKPKAFQCYLDNITVLEHLSDEEAGRLWKLLYNLAVNGERGECDDPMVSMAFDMMANKLESDFAAYERKVKASRENGRKGGAPIGNQNAVKQPKTTQYKDKDKDEDKDEDKNKDEYKNEDENEDEKTAEADAVAAAADVVSLYNDICVSLPDVEAVTDSLVNRVARLGDMNYSEYFERVQSSDFLSSRSGRWHGCNLDWLLRPDTVQKVRAGTYDNRKPKPAPSKASYDIAELEKIDTLEFIQ